MISEKLQIFVLYKVLIDFFSSKVRGEQDCDEGIRSSKEAGVIGKQVANNIIKYLKSTETHLVYIYLFTRKNPH
jgi:hypothetical protein